MSKGATSTGTTDIRLSGNTIRELPYVNDPARVEAIRVRLVRRFVDPLIFTRAAPDDVAYLLAQLGVR